MIEVRYQAIVGKIKERLSPGERRAMGAEDEETIITLVEKAGGKALATMSTSLRDFEMIEGKPNRELKGSPNLLMTARFPRGKERGFSNSLGIEGYVVKDYTTKDLPAETSRSEPQQ